jgi:hypothetical protein
VVGFPGLSKILKRFDGLGEGQNRLWGVKSLRIKYERMRKYMVPAFKELEATLGVTFEEQCR